MYISICINIQHMALYWLFSQFFHLIHFFQPASSKYLWLIFFFISLLFLQIGNALVCLAVWSNHSMRTVTNIFIVNLAVADFFVILFCLPPTVIWDVTETWFLSETMCKVVIYFQVSTILYYFLKCRWNTH